MQLALPLYRDESLQRPEQLLDAWGLINALYSGAPSLHRRPDGVRLRAKTTLADLLPHRSTRACGRLLSSRCSDSFFRPAVARCASGRCGCSGISTPAHYVRCRSIRIRALLRSSHDEVLALGAELLKNAKARTAPARCVARTPRDRQRLGRHPGERAGREARHTRSAHARAMHRSRMRAHRAGGGAGARVGEDQTHTLGERSRDLYARSECRRAGGAWRGGRVVALGVRRPAARDSRTRARTARFAFRGCTRRHTGICTNEQKVSRRIVSVVTPGGITIRRHPRRADRTDVRVGHADVARIVASCVGDRDPRGAPWQPDQTAGAQADRRAHRETPRRNERAAATISLHAAQRPVSRTAW